MNRLAATLLTIGFAVLPGVAQTLGEPEVFVNGHRLNSEQLRALQATTGVRPQSGCYWYDPRSGFYGFCGRETAGVLQPGIMDFGNPAPNVSRGNTALFINGRELNRVEKAFFERLFGPIPPSRWWLDGRTGNLGQEGNRTVRANLIAALGQARQQSTGDNMYRWRDGHGSVAGSDGNCTYMSVPGSNVYMSPGCQ